MAFLPDAEGEAEGFGEVTSGSKAAAADVVWSGSSAHSVDGFAAKLFWATKVQLMKIAALRAEGGTHKFEGTFDKDALAIAGLDPRGTFEDHLETVRFGLRGDDGNIQCSAKLTDSETLVVVISETERRRRYEYSLPLARVELSESDKLQLELDKSKAEVATLRQKNSCLKQKLVEKGKAVDDCKQQIDTLRATVSTLEKSLFEKDEAIRELKLSLRSKKLPISSAKPRVESRSAAVVALTGDKKDDTSFVFDTTKTGGITQPKKFKVTTDGKMATKTYSFGSSQILLRPSMREATHTIRFKLIHLASYNSPAIGFTDSVSHSIFNVCVFDINGIACIEGVSKRLDFSRKSQSGDIWTLSVDLSKGEVHVSASNLKRRTFQWVPKALPVFAAFYSGCIGDSVAIV